jgi:hypothetical protein
MASETGGKADGGKAERKARARARLNQGKAALVAHVEGIVRTAGGYPALHGQVNALIAEAEAADDAALATVAALAAMGLLEVMVGLLEKDVEIVEYGG